MLSQASRVTSRVIGNSPTPRRAVCFPSALRYNHHFFPPKNAANDRNSSPQHALQPTEPFLPQKPGEVTMYTCGPTVYDFAHIGNYRTFVFPGHPPPLPQTPRLPTHSRDESHRRRRPHHRQRRRPTRQHPRLHRKIRSSLLRRLQDPQHRVPRALGPRHGQHRFHGPANPAPPGKTYTYASEGSIYSTTASQNSRTMASLPKSISPASKPAPASTTTATKKRAPAISRSGKPPSPANISGTLPSAVAVPAGTSNAPPWP